MVTGLVREPTRAVVFTLDALFLVGIKDFVNCTCVLRLYSRENASAENASKCISL